MSYNRISDHLEQGNRNKAGQLIDDCEPTKSQGDSVQRRLVLFKAREKYPDKYIMLAPSPSVAFNGTYGLYVRPKNTQTIRDFDWNKIAEGSLADILNELT
jgi:hypothetical protein